MAATWLATAPTARDLRWANVVLAAAVLVLAVGGRGFFCGWLCVFGALQEWVHAAGLAVAERVAPLRRLRQRMLRVSGGQRWRWVDHLLRHGRWLVLAWALGGAAVTGTVVFREVDPWGALLRLAEFELSLAFIVLAVTFVLALFVERPFCRYACPLGALRGIVGKASPVAVQRDSTACLGCDLCNRACPMSIPVNARTRVTDSSCLGCLECVGACPSERALGLTIALPVPTTR